MPIGPSRSSSVDVVIAPDPAVIVAGSPPGIAGSTNALRIHNMGDAIHRVSPAYHDPELDEDSLLGDALPKA